MNGKIEHPNGPPDPVEEASEESFPASDPPAWTGTAIGKVSSVPTERISQPTEPGQSQYEADWGHRGVSRQIDKADWANYFDRVSRALEGKRATVEIAHFSFGDQIAAKLVPLLGIVYDRKDDIVEIAMENVDHMIRSPRAIFVHEEGLLLHAVEIVDGEGEKQLILISDPLMLPEPAD